MRPFIRNIGWGAFTVAVLLMANWLATYFEGHHFGYQVRIVQLVGIAIIAAVSLNIVNGFTGQFSIGHAGFYGLGAYTSAAITVYGQKALFGSHYTAGDNVGWLHGSAILLLTMAAGGIVAGLAGFAVGLPSLKLRGDYLAIVTLGFGQILIVIINNSDALGGNAGFVGNPNHPEVLIPGLSSFFWIYLVAVGVVALSLNLRRSVHGLAMESIREDEVAAEAMGIPTTKIKVFAFVISAFFTGVAGALFVQFNQSIAPNGIDFTTSMSFVVMIVLGGLGSVSGAIIGAIIITVLPQFLYDYDQYRMVIYALALIVLMLLRPQGILGRKELSMRGLMKRKRKSPIEAPS